MEVFNTLRRRKYFARLCTNFNNQAGVNTKTLAAVRLPMPPLAKQRKLVAAMDESRAAHRAKLAEADALLAGMDAFVLDVLAIARPQEDGRRVFAIPTEAASARFDPHFHTPRFAQIARMLTTARAVPLGELAIFSMEQWQPVDHPEPTFRYIEISDVSPKTGEASCEEVHTDNAPSRARMLVRTDDVIVSLTRPHHGSIAHLGPEHDGCIASTGFSVIRSVDTKKLRRDYLWCILRTQLCLEQMLQRASGGNYPAITEPELRKVLIPTPPLDVQGRIAVEASRRRLEARRLRQQADAEWQTAKTEFEAALLEGRK